MKKKIKTRRLAVLCYLIVSVLIACSVKNIILGGPVRHQELRDGNYIGEYRDGPVSAVVEVVIENQRISEVKILEHHEMRGKEAENDIPQLIVELQSTAVDAVSGATTSSTVIMNAAHLAIEKAYR